MFSPVCNKESSQDELNNDLQRVNDSAFPYQMRCNPGPTKQTKELYFLKKTKGEYYQNLTSNGCNVESCSSQKYLGLIKLITRFRVEFSHLNEHKFRCHFNDTMSPICHWSSEIELTQHSLLHCPFFLPKEINFLKVFMI